jgi:hypothetical protein
MKQTHFLFGEEANHIKDTYGIKAIALDNLIYGLFTYTEKSTSPTTLLNAYDGWNAYSEISEVELQELREAIDVAKIYSVAEDFINRHVNNSGELHFSEKEYSYLNDALDEVGVGYFNKCSESTYSIKLKAEGFRMLVKDARVTLSQRIEAILEELK